MSGDSSIENTEGSLEEEQIVFNAVHTSVHAGKCTDDGWVDFEHVVKEVISKSVFLEAPESFVRSRAKILAKNGILEVQKNSTGSIQLRLA